MNGRIFQGIFICFASVSGIREQDYDETYRDITNKVRRVFL